mmetsp:Transcript_10541/g.30107  ORF Transcript_10541/g.30107 Transcript_10541/m.30107 type:complete len:130 (-) Transcript_10541:696-1085(-)
MMIAMKSRQKHSKPAVDDACHFYLDALLTDLNRATLTTNDFTPNLYFSDVVATNLHATHRFLHSHLQVSNVRSSSVPASQSHIQNMTPISVDLRPEYLWCLSCSTGVARKGKNPPKRKFSAGMLMPECT